MKISQGNVWEFVIGLFLACWIIRGINIFSICGILACCHCVYLWAKQGAENRKKKQKQMKTNSLHEQESPIKEKTNTEKTDIDKSVDIKTNAKKNEELDNSFVCDNCGGIVKENAKKCPHCGSSFDEDDDNSKAIVCSNCGTVVNKSANKCPKCGEIFEDEEKDNNKEEKTSSNMDQKYSDLNKLKELLDNDIITKEEFEKEKKKILK